jgi:hypothetical protein
MKRVLLRSGKSPFHVATHEQAIHQDLIGTNSGNLVFSDAAHKILLTENTDVISNGISTVPTAAGKINEEYDAFVVPLANAFRPSFERSLDKLSQLIENLTIPVVILGVGAQTGLTYDPSRLRGIEPSVKRFARAVLNRSSSIGVRGEFTERYLNDLGFRDVEVIGCPSMFMNGPTFSVEKSSKGLTSQSRIAINASQSATGVGDVGHYVRHAYEKYPNLQYIAQNLTDAELLFWGDVSEASDQQSEMPKQRTHPLLQNNKVRVFIDSATWINELRSYDFSFGTRIHGNIAALLAGTPSTVLCHDSRTLELCRYFEIPHRLFSDVKPDIDPADLYEDADFGPLINGHQERFNRFTDFLDKHDLENTFTHGDNGLAYDHRVAALPLPPAIEVWDGSADSSLGYRINWLRDQVHHMKRNQAKVAKQLTTLEKRLTALEKRPPSLSVRAKRVIKRTIRKSTGK